MGLTEVSAILVVITAVFSVVNYHTFRLPGTIGTLLIALLMSLALVGLGSIGVPLGRHTTDLLRNIDFGDTLMNGMLAFLLFAGALQIRLKDLAEEKWAVLLLATVGVIVSTFVVGGLTWLIVSRLGILLTFSECLLFGALISPTDPVAVLALLKSAGIPKNLQVKIAGESLFNDGIGLVVFTIILQTVRMGGAPSFTGIATLFAQEAVGGALFGLAIGSIAYQVLKGIDDYKVEVLVSLATVMGGFALANAIHVSGPLAMVAAGLLIGNHGRAFAMSDTTREHHDTFWELIDEILNAVLFVLIGLEVLVVPITRQHFIAGAIAIPVTLLGRLVSVGGTITFLRRFRPVTRGAVRIITWGGLRGGISVAMALSLSPGPTRTTILAVTYMVVVFSVLVQGITIQGLAAKISRQAPSHEGTL